MISLGLLQAKTVFKPGFAHLVIPDLPHEQVYDAAYASYCCICVCVLLGNGHGTV